MMTLTDVAGDVRVSESDRAETGDSNLSRMTSWNLRGCWFVEALRMFAIVMSFSITGSIMAQETITPSPVMNGKIAFVRKANNGAGFTRILVMDLDGTNQMRVGNSLFPYGEDCPTWSPDGRKIVFSGKPGHPPANICIMDGGGSNQTCLTNNPDATWDWCPAWSPDGTKIAFSRLVNANGGGFPPDDQWQIYVMDSDGSNQIRLTQGAESSINPTWSADGTRIAFTRFGSVTRFVYSEIYVMDADGSNQMQLTNSAGIRGAMNEAPDWSPGGTKIAFSRYGTNSNIQIYVMNSDGSNVAKITSNGGEGPFWSPDGTKIAFTNYRSGHAAVHVIDADGSNEVILTSSTSSSYASSWQRLPAPPATHIPDAQ